MATASRREQHPEVTVLRGVRFRDYVRLIRHPDNRHLRMAYHDGVLEIMSPQIRQHEIPAGRIRLIVAFVALARGVRYERTGTGTFRRAGTGPRQGSGREPDESFYFGNLDRLPVDRDPDLNAGDPPPDLWIEVDNRASSQARLPTYARLGVPEVWQYRSRSGRLRFLQLIAGQYQIIEQSLALPVLTPTLVLEALNAGATMSESDWLPWLQRWAEQFCPEPIG